ncbi:hypothetical protein WJX77_000114 [Trebouxia sp. C0004]
MTSGQKRDWLQLLRFPQACHQCGQDFTEESNHSTACTYHPGQFNFSILRGPAHFAGKRDDMVLLSGWQCCGKSVRGHPGCPAGVQQQHVPGHGTVAGVVLRDSTIQRPVIIDTQGTRYVVGQTTTKCCYKYLLTVPGCITDCHRGSLTLASQLEGPTAEQQTFIDSHKLAYQRAKSQQTIACTRCKYQFHLGQQGGCAYHPGAMDFTCKNEGRPNERNIFDRYECCQRTVLHTPGCRLDGRHASHTVDTCPFQVHDQALEQACTSCCHKILEDVPGCQPTDHVSVKPEIQFAQDEATHMFYVRRFMTSVARYVRQIGQMFSLLGGIRMGWSHRRGHAQSKIGDLVTSIVCPQVQQCASRAWTPKEVAHFVDREAYAAFDKLLMESAATAAGTVVSCPACGDYSEYQPDANDADGFPLQPVQLFRCIKCLKVSCLQCKAAVGLDVHVQHDCALTADAARRKLEERRQIIAANKYIASLEPSMALQVVENNILLRDFPDGSILLPAQ